MDRKAIARVVLAGVWRGFLASLLVPMLFMWRAILHGFRSIEAPSTGGGGGGGMIGGGGGGGGLKPVSPPPPQKKEGGEG